MAPAASTTRNPLTQLSDAYAHYLFSNAGRLSRVESTLRSLTYLLPGQTLSSEGLYTSLNLLTAYHDTLLSSYAERTTLPGGGQQHSSSSSSTMTGGLVSTSLALPSSPHARYTRWWLKQSKLYRTVARLLSIIGYCQLLFEMAGKKFRGEQGRWRMVIGLESIKSVDDLLNRRTLSMPFKYI